MNNDMNEEDWKRFDAIKDTEITASISNDEDWRDINLSEKLGWKVVQPDGSTIFPLTLDAKLTKFIQDTHLDYQIFLTGVLKEYAEKQQKL